MILVEYNQKLPGSVVYTCTKATKYGVRRFKSSDILHAGITILSEVEKFGNTKKLTVTQPATILRTATKGTNVSERNWRSLADSALSIHLFRMKRVA